MAAQLIAASLMILLSCGIAMAADAPRRVTVSDLLAKPKPYLDQPIVVTGVVASNSYGPRLCELPAQRKAGERECIDLSGPGLTIRRNDLRASGVVIEIEGYFSHGCFADVPEDSEIKVVVLCIHRGGNGWVMVESMRVVGAVVELPEGPCGYFACWPFEEVAREAPLAQGIDELARKVATAWRAGDESKMLALTLPSLRPETEWDLLRADRTAAERFLRPRFRLAPDSVLEPGVGYRLFQVSDPDEKDVVYHQLCYCVSGDCADAWKQPFGRYFFGRHPIDCFDVWRGPEGWTLL